MFKHKGMVKRTKSLLRSALLHGVEETRARHQHALKEHSHDGRRAMQGAG